MSFRSRIFLGACLLILLPLFLLAIFVRYEASRRLSRQHMERVETLSALSERALLRRGENIDAALEALKRDMVEDSRLRLAIVNGNPGERPYLIDFAASQMALLGLDALQLHDSSGRVLSSGQFRNAFDRVEPGLIDLVAAYENPLLRLQTDNGERLVLARVDSLRLGARSFYLLGGRSMDEIFLTELAGGSGLEIALALPDEAGDPLLLGTDPALLAALGELEGELFEKWGFARLGANWFLRERQLVLVDAAPGRELRTALLCVGSPRDDLVRLLRGLDLTLLLALLLSVAGSLLLAVWLSARVTRPLRDLAERTQRVDLERLDVDFGSERRDEVGVLSRFLGDMTTRLAAGARRLKDAERRLTLAELSRQVTHDIRNGFTPLRNVIAHLSQVARDEPEDLPRVYGERQGTLESGLGYLEDLAGHYSRLAPRSTQTRFSLNELLLTLLPGSIPGEGLIARHELAPDLPPLTADATSLRRVVENLLRNARESLPAAGGTITLRSRRERVNEESSLVIEVEDTGCGIAAAKRDRIFEDFYSSKPEGSGLGLSIVRRLVADLGGSLELVSEPGAGSCFSIILPLEPGA